MFFTVARLRLLAFSLVFSASFAHGRVESLFTSSVTYCAPPETLLIQQFDVAYFPQNSSVSFNISAASVEANVNVSANVLLNVYGMHPFNFTLDLCSIFHGALCPLPQYNFTGSDSIPLPSSVDVSNKIPGIAYKIPDLEAFAQLTLVEVGTGDVKACVQSTLSNGWSTRQPAVEWSTGALAILALLSSLWQSISPDALAPYRFLDLLYLYQTIATTGLLNLNYPSVYRSFTLNFAWAMGFFWSSSVQNSINNMRHLTGGDMADASSGSAIGLVNRKLSPYNVPPPPSEYALQQSFFADSAPQVDFTVLSGLTSFDVTAPTPLENITELQAGAVATVTQASSNVLEAGVPIYVNTLNIATANAFMTVFFTVLMITATALATLALGYFGILMMLRMGWGKEETLLAAKRGYSSFARAWCLRLCLIVFAPTTIFTFYQWTLKDSWLSIFLSVITLLSVLGYILYSTFLTLRMAYGTSSSSLHSNAEHLTTHGPIYAQYRDPRYYFYIPLLIATVLRALFVAFAKGNGEVQLILLIILEVLILVAHFVLKPHKTRGGDVLATYLAVVRLVSTGLMIGFLEQLALAAIPRVAIGIVIAVILSIAVVVMFINTLMHLRLQCLRLLKSSSRSPTSQSSTDAPMLEQSDIEKSGGFLESHDAFQRPRNPTPDNNIPLDPQINRPYPDITPTHTTAEQRSICTRDSGSTTLGSLLPSRWSFTNSHSRPNSPLQYSASPQSTHFASVQSSPRQSAPSSGQPTVEEHPLHT